MHRLKSMCIGMCVYECVLVYVCVFRFDTFLNSTVKQSIIYKLELPSENHFGLNLKKFKHSSLISNVSPDKYMNKGQKIFCSISVPSFL